MFSQHDQVFVLRVCELVLNSQYWLGLVWAFRCSPTHTDNTAAFKVSFGLCYQQTSGAWDSEWDHLWELCAWSGRGEQVGGPRVTGRTRRPTAGQTVGFWGEFLQPAEKNHRCGHAGDNVCMVLYGHCVRSVYYVRQNQAEARRHLEYLKSLPSPRKTPTETDTLSTGFWTPAWL